jgi:hypothetical protein
VLDEPDGQRALASPPTRREHYGLAVTGYGTGMHPQELRERIDEHQSDLVVEHLEEIDQIEAARDHIAAASQRETLAGLDDLEGTDHIPAIGRLQQALVTTKQSLVQVGIPSVDGNEPTFES